MRILLIDDEETVRKLVRRMLERGGHEVTQAENGRIGLERLKTGTFDLVITDIIMPEMEGIETLMRVREEHPNLRVIVMSGGGRTGNVDFLEAAQKLGASAILHKPFTQAALANAIEQALGAREGSPG